MTVIPHRLRHPGQLLIVMTIFVLGYVLGSQTGPSAAQSVFTQPAGAESTFEAFWQVYELIQEEFVPPNGSAIVNEVLVDGAIRGMIDSLDDANSGYMTATQYPVFFDDLSGAIEGIGVVISTNEALDAIEIMNVLEGTPAAKAGVRVGDVFAEVDGKDVLGISQLELASLVRGPSGTTVELTLLRDGEPINFTLTRARIDVPNIEFEVIDGTNLGYIKLNQFTAEARAEIDTALANLDTDTLDGLIFDFRGNPGGLLSSAVEVASAFIEDGPILIEDFGDGRERNFEADGSYLALDLPLAVLVDERSASASELVAGALQDTGTAIIIGETTFGKGTVQNIQPLVNGGGLRLTIARWLTPDRHWIHDLGIEPDLLVEWDDDAQDDTEDPQLESAIEHLQSLVLTPVQQ